MGDGDCEIHDNSKWDNISYIYTTFLKVQNPHRDRKNHQNPGGRVVYYGTLSSKCDMLLLSQVLLGGGGIHI